MISGLTFTESEKCGSVTTVEHTTLTSCYNFRKLSLKFFFTATHKTRLNMIANAEKKITKMKLIVVVFSFFPFFADILVLDTV